MTRVLVTGCSVGKDLGVCDACQYDYSWILYQPSTFIWAEKIYVTQGTWDSIQAGIFPLKAPATAKTIKLIFEMLKAGGVVEVVDVATLVPPEAADLLKEEVEADRQVLARRFPDVVHLDEDAEVPGQTVVHGVEYCGPYLSALYGSLLLSQRLGAECLFNPPALFYLRYKFGLSSPLGGGDGGPIQALRRVFEAHVPCPPIISEYVFMEHVQAKRNCSNCAEETLCRDTYLSLTEEAVRNALLLRSHDVIQQVRSEIKSIIGKRKPDGVIDAIEVERDFRERRDMINQRMASLFPKVERWTNVATLVSIPLAVLASVGGALATGSPVGAVAGVPIAGSAKALQTALQYLRSRNSWVGFTTENVETGNFSHPFVLPPEIARRLDGGEA